MAKDLTLEIRAQNKELKQKLAESKRELSEFKRAVKDANSAAGGARGASKFSSILSSIGLNAGKANTVMGFMSSGLGKLAGALGIAIGVGEAFNTVVSSSNLLGDEFERVQTQAGSAVNYFANSLANVDFSNFWTGLQNAITAGGRLADILDRINTELQGLGVRGAERALKIAELEGEAAKLARNDPARQKIYDEIKKLQEENIRETQALASEMYQGAITRVASAAGLSGTEQATYQKDIEDLLRNKSDKQIEDIAEAYQKLNKARAASKNVTTGGAGGGFNYKDVNKYTQEVAEAEKALKKLGVTQRQAQILSRITDVSDNKEDSPLTKARKEAQTSFSMMTAAQQQMNNLTARETMLRERMKKSELAAYKTALANAKKTYTANATTEFALKANITALSEMRDKVDPLTQDWKQYNDEIVQTQRKIDKIDLQKLSDNTFAKLRLELQLLNSELENTVIGSERFKEVKENIKSVEKAINEADMSTVDWTDNTKRGLEAQRAALQKLLETFEPDMVDAIKAVNDAIEIIDKDLEKFGKQPNAGSLDAINKQIQDLQKELNATGSSERRIQLTAQISKLEYDKDLMQQTGNPKLNYTPSYDQTQKSASYDQASQSAQAIKQDYEIGVIGYDEVKAKLLEINSTLKEMGMEPLQIRVESKGMKKAKKTIEGLGETISGVGDALEALGQISDDPAINIAGLIAGAIANIMFGYAQATTAAASMGPWAWIAFAIAGLATALSTVASIESATSGYAGGGIVGGSSLHGDMLLARVNSGEMILNGSQQANLFKALDSGNIDSGEGGNVHFVLRGSDLYGSLKNYAAMKGKAGHSISL